MFLCHTAYGDVPPFRSPLPKPPMVAPVKVVEGEVDDVDPNAVAKIIIPKSVAFELQGTSIGRGVSTGSLPGGTIIAGLALSAVALSLMFFGKAGTQWKKGMIGGITLLLLVAIVLLANSLSRRKSIVTDVESKPNPRIVIEFQGDGHEVLLVLPRRKGG